ncbi:MAG: ribonuclease R [Pirellulaceae bacterium]|nr:ribonuclease R [Pirellulaceae bacterium]
MTDPSPEQAKLEQAILDHVGRASYQPVKPRVIAKKLGVAAQQVADVRRAVKRLVRQGRLAYGANHLVESANAARPSGHLVVGAFRRNDKGYGFVRPAGAKTPDAEPVDIYIPAKRAGDASTGDLVQVRLVSHAPRHPERGPRGEIVAVLRRQTHQFVGTYFESRGVGCVRVDGPMFAQPISVGDPGAKNVRDDDKVVIDMVRFPTEFREGEGVITEVLGPLGKPGVDTLSIIREFDLPDEFAEDALAQAHQQAESFDETIPADRKDLTGETIITIDPPDARDFDDAISLVRLDGGHWLLGVHIADVAHFVPTNTPLDREALARATSVYLPDRVIPMLPEVISNSLASLQPGKPRFAKTVFIEYTADGQRVGAEFHSSVIRSAKRLNYDEVDAFLAAPDTWREQLGPDVHALLGRMHELAMMLRQRRFQRGALALDMPEIKIELDRQGRVSGAHVAENTESHQIIEEFMLAANEAVAETLSERQLHFLRRIHGNPTPRKMKALTEFVNELGFRTGSLESRFELQKLLDHVADRPERHAVHFAVLRSLERAVYGPQVEGHYALASECYGHFTSPIRRYPDLTVHRLLNAVLVGDKPRNDYDELVLLGEHCSDRERRAETAERELVKLKLLGYLAERVGWEMDAVVTGVERFGLFVQGIELPAEGLVHIDSLADDTYYFDRASHTLSGRRAGNAYRLGDPIRVAVVRVDLERRELDLRVVGRKRPGAQEQPKTAKPTRTPSNKTKRRRGHK